MAAAEGSALTGVAWSAAPDAAPAGWTVITGTVEGTPANLGKGFGNKGGGYLCVSTGGAQASPGSVVTDVQVLSDRTPHPPRLHPRPRVPGVPSRRLPEKTGVREAAAGGRGRGGCDRAEGDREEQDAARVPQNRGMGPPEYLKIGYETPLNTPKWDVGPPKYLEIGSPMSIKRESPYDASGIYGLSAMDGVPFTLHPKFEAKLNSGTNALLADLSVKSLADIDREVTGSSGAAKRVIPLIISSPLINCGRLQYNYTFVVERTAAARLPPGVS
ncbi:hypothetical protein Q9233_017417 [Columba guinea]|nr:hypothetical protein Q9233_017417 [Columba guinea]